MKKFFTWQVKLAIGLLLLSVVFYFIHYLIFKNPTEILDWLLNNIAFVFINVLIVTLILQGMLEYRDKKSKLSKMNMVIGTFFSEAGRDLGKMFSGSDEHTAELSPKLKVSADWTDKDFTAASKFVEESALTVDKGRESLPQMKAFLLLKRAFLLSLLENPNLLEHESFTDLLWAVFHLTDELTHRRDVSNVSAPDMKHLTGDMNRAYKLLILHWLAYMKHLKKDYPYLFSLAVRTNPFDPEASAEVKE